MIYLDTHVVVWLYAGMVDRLTSRGRNLMEISETLLISPMVLLELDYLHETGRTRTASGPVLTYLGQRIGLEICDRPFPDIVRLAARQSWTRDPFDRIITAQAALGQDVLLTKDGHIRSNYSQAVWE